MDKCDKIKNYKINNYGTIKLHSDGKEVVMIARRLW